MAASDGIILEIMSNEEENVQEKYMGNFYHYIARERKIRASDISLLKEILLVSVYRKANVKSIFAPLK